MLFPFLNERAWMRVALRKSATRDRRDFLFACVINAGISVSIQTCTRACMQHMGREESAWETGELYAYDECIFFVIPPVVELICREQLVCVCVCVYSRNRVPSTPQCVDHPIR